MRAGAPQPAVLSALKTVLGCAFLVAALPFESLLRNPATHPSATQPADDAAGQQLLSQSSGDVSSDASEEGRSPALSRHGEFVSTGGVAGAVRVLLNKPSGGLQYASAELGLYSAAGAIAQAWGLAHISATQAGFLIQFTAVFTPLLDFLAGRHVGGRTWRACGIALAGTVLISLDSLSGAAATAAETAAGAPVAERLSGSAAIMLAAMAYSAATFRISILASEFGPVELAAGKNVGMACVAIGAAGWALAPELARQGVGVLNLDQLWPSHADARSIALLVWAAIGPGAVASLLQTYGQSTVPASKTQVIFTSIPLWSAMIAYTFLHEDPFGGLGWAGACLVVIAGVLSASKASV